MTYPDDDEIEFADYAAMDQAYHYHPERQIRTETERRLEQQQLLRGFGMEHHPLWPRIQAEGWTNEFDPDVYLYKEEGGVEYGIWPEYRFDFQPGARGWRVAASAEGFYWQKFDTLGDALDSVKNRNFRGYERLLPDPDNTEDSDYERVLYAFAIAHGEVPYNS